MSRDEDEINALRDPETMTLFVEESLEALQRLETSLMRAEQGDAPADLVDVMFRQMHTFKASAAYLMFDKSRSLAHAAEDMLVRLRDGEVVLTGEHVRALLGTNDSLRALVQEIRRSGQEGALDVAALIADLRRQALSAPSTPPSAKPAPASQREAGETGPEHEAPEAADGGEATVRVNVKLLDRIVHLATELVLARNQAVQQLQLLARDSSAAQNTCQRLSNVTTDLQEQVMKTRMQPVARIFEKIPRVARDVAQLTGKQVLTRVHDNAAEIDRALFETVRDPILHVVRNAIDHGIEAPEERVRDGKPASGMLTLRAHHVGSTVTVEIEDDGRGMDPERLRAHALSRGIITAAEERSMSPAESLELVFRPGFSTAATVTDLSGRGVGMDVVRTQMERSGGRVELESVAGKGTVVRLHMPLTLAIIPALLVGAAGQRYAVPQNHLVELVYLGEQQASDMVRWVGGVRVLRLRGVNLPMVDLRETLQLPAQDATVETELHIVVVAADAMRYALVVGQVENTEDIVIKPLRGPLRRHPTFSGVAVLGEGAVALILDVAGLGARAGLEGMAVAEPRHAESARSETHRQPWLVFDAEGTACALPLSAVDRIEEVPARLIETLAGHEVLQYRSTFLAVLRPERVLTLTSQALAPAPDTQTLIVLSFARPVALAVRGIVDVVDVSLDTVTPSDAVPGALGQAVLFSRATLMLDVYTLVRALAPQATQPTGQQRLQGRVLLLEANAGLRATVGLHLMSAGLEVVPVTSVAEARAALAGQPPFLAAIADADLPEDAGWRWMEQLTRQHPQMAVLAWTQEAAESATPRALQVGAITCIHKLQRERILPALGLLRGDAEARP